MRKNKKRILTTNNENICYSLLVFFLVFCSDSQLFCYNANELMCKFGEYTLVVLSILFFIHYLRMNHYCVDRKCILLFGAIICLLACGLYHGEFSGGYISKIALFVLGFSICRIFNVSRIVKGYILLLTWICIFSLIGLFLAKAIIQIPFIPSIHSTTGIDYK